MTDARENRDANALVLVALALSVVVYQPLTQNFFYADDFLNLYRIANEDVLRYLLTPHGGHALVLRNGAFYLFDRVFGTNAAAYFWAVLATHLVNVWLLFFLIRRFTRSASLACFGATLWGTAPVHDGALGWYSVYGHVLAGTVLLLILTVLARAGESGKPRPPGRRLCYALALAAVMLFGVGLGIGFVLPLAAAVLVPAWRGATGRAIPLWTLFLTVPVLYFGLFWANGLVHTEGLDTPAKLTTYAAQNWTVVVPFVIRLVAFGMTRLVLGFWYQAEMYGPVEAYAVTGILLVAGVVAARRLPLQARRALIASALMALGCYGMIALGRVLLFQAWGSIMESQPRYHYAALAPLTIVMCLILESLTPRRFPSAAKALLLTAWIAALVGGYVTFGFAMDHHAEAREQTDQVTQAIDSSIAEARPGTLVYIQNRPFQQVPLIIPMTDFPGWAAVFVIFYPAAAAQVPRQVYFVEKNPDVIAAAADGYLSHGLLVPEAGENHR